MYEGRRPKGFRDIPPDLMIVRKRVIQKIEEVFRSYGFDPIETPAIEYWETLAGKYGDEAENRLIWRFQDPLSGRWYALRYDLTVPLARYITTNQDTPLPFKRYHIAPVWRHEEPQRGRYREFYQCDIDTVGSPHPEADAEILETITTALNRLGFKGGYQVKVNDRRILRGIFEQELGITDPIPVYRAIDKLDKIGEEGVRRELMKTTSHQELVDKIMETISFRGPLQETLQELEKHYKNNQHALEGIHFLQEAATLLEGLDAEIVFDMSLVRGLDYYTGPIYEAFLHEPRIGAVAGGGRYDNLIGIFLHRQIPATGASLGLERIIDALIETGRESRDEKTYTRVQVIYLKPELKQHAWLLARTLRQTGVPTRIDLLRGSPKKQSKRANRLGIPVLIYIGPREAETGLYTIYNTRTGERLEGLTTHQIIEYTQKKL